jgi:hypothetical protein
MAVQTVTSENRAEYMASRIKPAKETPIEKPADVKIEEKPAVVAKPDEKATVVDADQKPAKNSIDERLAELTARRKDAEKLAQERERERDEARRELEALRKPKDAKPDPKDFTDPVKYGEAYGEWLAEDKLRQRAEKDRKEADEKRQADLTTEWNKRYKKASKEIEDFEEVIMAEPLSLQPAVVNAMYESEVGPQLHYFFSKDREEADKINKMTPSNAVRYLGRIEARIELEQAAKLSKGNVQIEPAKPVKRAAEAPEPITPINGSSSPGTGGVVDADGNVTGSYAEYKAARRAGKIK